MRVAAEKKAAHRHDDYWGRPVPGFGDVNARVLVLGLAPAAHGANRTGRVFTGDGSGDFLMRAMHATGFANIATSQRSDDGLALTHAWIAAAVRCAPPGNKPTPAEIAACHPHLVAEFGGQPWVSFYEVGDHQADSLARSIAEVLAHSDELQASAEAFASKYTTRDMAWEYVAIIDELVRASAHEGEIL